MRIILPVLFSQFDDRWASILLGNNTDSRYNIYNYGCLLSCLAMVAEYFGHDTDPARLNQLLKDNGGFEQGSGIYDWGSITKVFPDVKDSIVKTPNLLTDQQIGDIKNALDAGKPVIVQIDYNPKTVDPDMHFVIIVAYNPDDENDFTIADPLGGKLHSLKDYLGWFKPSARTSIDAYSVMDGVVPNIANADTTVAVSKVIFPNIVHGSTQWNTVWNKYGSGKDPKDAQASDLIDVIGGIQSTATAAQNKLAKQTSDAAAAQQEAKNAEEKLAVEQQQRQDDQKMYSAKIDALTASSGNLDKISGIYQGRLDALQKQLNSTLAEKHDLAIANAKLKAQNPISLFERFFPSVVALFQKKITK